MVGMQQLSATAALAAALVLAGVGTAVGEEPDLAVCTPGEPCADEAPPKPVPMEEPVFMFPQPLFNLRPECGGLVNYWACEESSFGLKLCHSNAADFDRPLKQVVEEIPGIDGSCHFHRATDQIRYPREVAYYPLQALKWVVRTFDEQHAGSETTLEGGKGPEVTYKFEGKTLTSHADASFFPGLDLLAYSLGFLQRQGIDTTLMTSASAWEAVAVEQCRKIRKKYDFLAESSHSLRQFVERQATPFVKGACAAGTPLKANAEVLKANGYVSATECKQPTGRELADFFNMHCHLGPKAAGAVVAYLHATGCLLEGNRIGHLGECA